MAESSKDRNVPTGIQFANQPNLTENNDALIITIPSGVTHKRDLLAIFVRNLKFPRYFGWNWDSFEECLRDLSWIKQPRRIIIVHDSLPFLEGQENRETYLSILLDAVNLFQAEGGHKFIAVFPERARAAVLSAINLPSAEQD